MRTSDPLVFAGHMLQPSQHESHPILCFPPLNWFVPGGAIYPYLSTTTAGNTLKVVSCMANGCRADATETTPRLYLVGRNVKKGNYSPAFAALVMSF